MILMTIISRKLKKNDTKLEAFLNLKKLIINLKFLKENIKTYWIYDVLLEVGFNLCIII
jgi:hypothetical protein